jgi:hypothetical protein
MHLICRPFWWPWWCAGAIQMAFPNAACPQLLRKPLDAGIGQLLALYCPSGHQGNRHTNNNQQIHLQSWPFLMAMAMRWYVTARIAWWRRSRASLEATGCRHRASIMPDNIVRATAFFFDVLIVKTVGKGHGLMLRTLFLIGVWHIKRKRRA